MKIMLTGATGFLGGHLLKALLKETDHDIVVLKRSKSSVSCIRQELENASRISCYDIDVTPLEIIFDAERVDAIIHCATEYGRDATPVSTILETNLMFPISLLELSAKYKVCIFINTDSYFNKENLSYTYLLNYALSKKSLNLWLSYFSKNIKIINIVLEHIYGPNDDSAHKFTAQMIDLIAVKDADAVKLSQGNQKRDFIYVNDVVDAYISVLEYAKKNVFDYEVFNIGTGQTVSIKEFVCTIKRLSGSRTELLFGAVAERENEIMYSAADTSVFDKIGWHPRYSLEEGIKECIESERKG